MGKKEDFIIEQQRILNSKLANFFKENGIRKFNLISLGNSIGSGYSMYRTTKPLLLRNESLKEMMQTVGIQLDVHHFARAQNNSDEHLFEWLATNISESEIHKFNRYDYDGGVTSLPTYGITKEKLDEYYPLQMENDVRLQDAVLETGDNVANIIVYNGCTGSFLDNVTRNGKLTRMLTYGIKRDTYGLESTLKFIQSNNRKNNTNTQVYICGVPNFLGLKISEIINVRLKNIAEKYANVVYVEPVESKLFYKPLAVSENMNFDDAHNMFKKFFCNLVDIHYDEEEYLKLNNNIMKAINDNYSIVSAMVNVDRELYEFNSILETCDQQLLENEDYIQLYITQVLSNESSRFLDDKEKIDFFKRIKRYLKDRLPYDFYYVGKKNIQRFFEKSNKKR